MSAKINKFVSASSATKIETFLKNNLKKDLPNLQSGDTVKVYQKIPAQASASADKKEAREKSQVFEGVVIAKKHGKEMGSTITVRKVISGVGVERIFPLHSPLIDKIEVVRKLKVRRAKLYYLRQIKGRKTRLRKKEISALIAGEKPTEETTPETSQ